MKISILFFFQTLSLFSANYANKIFKDKNININNEKDEDFYQIRYQFHNGDSFDFSGYKSFLPTKLHKNNSIIELTNSIIQLLRSKGVEIEDLKALVKDNDLVIQIYFSNKKDFIRSITLDKDLEELYNQFQEQQENKKNHLYSKTFIPKVNQDAIKELMNLFLQKYTGKKDGGIILDIKQNNRLLITNYHKDLYPISKKINEVKFFFVRNNNGVVEYTHKIPKGINLSKLKQSLNIDDDNFFYSVFNLFIKFPLINVIERDNQKLQEYLKNEGYNTADLLDIKYIEYDNHHIAYIYIFVGEKLSVKNVSFSFENNHNQLLLQELQKIYPILMEDKDILKETYTPDVLELLVKKNVHFPFEIIKTINEISYPQKGYNVNFHIKIALNNFFIENIFFIGTKNKNLYKKINSKIGYNFSQKILDEDGENLKVLLKDKVEWNVENGSADNLKIIIVNIGEPFDFNKIFEKIKPSFGFGLDGLTVQKAFQTDIKIDKLKVPFIFNAHFHKRQLFYVIDGKIEMDIKSIILDMLNKKDSGSSYLNIITGSSFLWRSKELLRKFIGFNIGNNNYKFYNEDRPNHKYYYKIDLDILRYSSDKNKNKNKNKEKEKEREMNLIHDGWNFQNRIALGKEGLIFLKDNIEINFIINDKINLKKFKQFFDQPFANISINYGTLFFNKLFFQTVFNGLMSHHGNDPYLESDLGIIGKKFDDIKALKNEPKYNFHKGLHNLSFLLWRIKKIDSFIGQSIEIFLGLYNHWVFYINNETKNNKVYLWYSGIVLSIRMSFFTFNLYIPLNIISKDSNKRLRWFDFSFESANNQIKNKNNNLIYRNKMPLDKNML
jgi:hypothetical protein